MNKTATLLAILACAAFLLPTVVVSGEPMWGPFEPWVSFKVTPSGLHIVKDPMFDPADLPEYMDPAAAPLGWVTYVCTSEKPQNMPKGFDYSVAAKGLTPGATYDVKAYPLEESSDYGVVTSHSLGTLTADGNGEGKSADFMI